MEIESRQREERRGRLRQSDARLIGQLNTQLHVSWEWARWVSLVTLSGPKTPDVLRTHVLQFGRCPES